MPFVSHGTADDATSQADTSTAPARHRLEELSPEELRAKYGPHYDMLVALGRADSLTCRPPVDVTDNFRIEKGIAEDRRGWLALRMELMRA
jgi:hypothetical protein